MPLKFYSLLTVKQALILFQSHRKQALAHDNHDKSRHLYHLKQYLKHSAKAHHITKCISYEDLTGFLIAPYINDTDYDKQTLVNDFRLTKDNAKANAINILKQNSIHGEPMLNVKADSKSLQNAKQSVYTPSITTYDVHSSQMDDNHQAKILFKKYYHNNFKKANIGSENIGKSYFSTVGRTEQAITKRITQYKRDVKSLTAIIKSIKKIEKTNPKLSNNVDLEMSDETPLETYQTALRNSKIEIKSHQHNLKSYKKLDNAVLLCDGHIANARDVKSDFEF